MHEARQPALERIDHVHDIGNGYLFVTGWDLGSCVTGCPCHRHPDSGQLAIDQDQTRGRLRLVSPAAGGCHCCEPWTAYELADVLRDLVHIEALSHGGGCQLAEGTS